MNICWYKDGEAGIYFDKIPNVTIRYVTCNSTLGEAKNINKKPFINLSDLNVFLFDYVSDNFYEFLIPENYLWDGASVPRIFWRLIGSNTDQRFLIPSLIHDVLCENHNYIDNDRYFSTIVFERLLYVSKVSAFNRWMIKHSVDNFQKIAGRWE